MDTRVLAGTCDRTSHMACKGSMFLQALDERSLSAKVVEVDKRRSTSSLSITVDYVIEVKASNDISFRISKTYAQFRELASKFKQIYREFEARSSSLPPAARKCLDICAKIVKLVEHNEKSYLGKLNYKVAEHLAAERRKTIDRVLTEIARLPPDVATHASIAACVDVLEDFGRTDHVHQEEVTKSTSSQSEKRSLGLDPLKKLTAHVHVPTKLPGVAPLTFKRRRSVAERKLDQEDLQLLHETDTVELDDETPVAPVSVDLPPAQTLYSFLEENKLVAVGTVPFLVIALRYAGDTSITIPLDAVFLMVFAGLAIGCNMGPDALSFLKLPSSSASQSKAPRATVVTGQSVARKSMVSSNGPSGMVVPELLEETTQMQEFPAGASIGFHKNCWSNPSASTFHVRGHTYFRDKHKEPSGPFLFPIRRVELFITDACPTHVARNPDILDGKLRDKATFIINFVLPWGVLVFYFEIPGRFLPFLEARYKPFADLSSLDLMSAGERTVCRWLMNDADYKNQRFKIVPSVVEGPWVVKQAVGGKPALIGAKMPIVYHYEAGGGASEHPYLEADLDIAASSVARGILSVVRKYTNALTINLGFVIESREEDELPEQMLVGACLHGIDPLICPALPPMPGLLVLDDDISGSVAS